MKYHDESMNLRSFPTSESEILYSLDIFGYLFSNGKFQSRHGEIFFVLEPAVAAEKKALQAARRW